jgi:hypothetical protein
MHGTRLLGLWLLLASAASAQTFRIVDADGRRWIERPDGARYWAHGFSVEPAQENLLRIAAAFRFQPVHCWTAGASDTARSILAAREAGLDAAVFVPLNGPYARFLDGSESGDNIPFRGAPWSRVPDFYSPQWQEGFLRELVALKDALGGDLSTVAILWLTNEPEIVRAYGDWRGADFCLNTPACLRQFRLYEQLLHPTIGDLNAAWSAGGDYAYAFPDFVGFEATCLRELAGDAASGGLSPGASADLRGFVRQWLGDWVRTVRDLVRTSAGIEAPLLGIRVFPGCMGEWGNVPTEGLDLLGINWYDSPYGTGYVRLQEAAYQATGLPTIVSEWFLQHTDPGDLGYVCGDEVTQAEQTAFACDLMRQCPTSVGEIWQNYAPNPGSLAEQPLGHVRPFVYERALLADAPPAAPTASAYVLDGFGYRSDLVQVAPTAGPPERESGVRWRLAPPAADGPIGLPVEPGTFRLLRGELDGRGLLAGGADSLGRLASACAKVDLRQRGRYRCEVTAEGLGPCFGARLDLELNGVPRGSLELNPGPGVYACEFAAEARTYFLTLRADAGDGLGAAVRVTSVRVSPLEAGAEAAPYLPMAEVTPDLTSLPVILEDALSPPSPALWRRHAPEGDGGTLLPGDGGGTALRGAPWSRAGIETRSAFASDAAVVEARALLDEADMVHGNLIVNLVFDAAYPPVPSWEWALGLGPSPTKRTWSGGAGESRLEFGWSMGEAWEWRVSNGVASPGPSGAVAARGGEVVLRVERVGCRYQMLVNGERALAVWEPALSGPFRVFLYSFGDTRAHWRSVRVSGVL